MKRKLLTVLLLLAMTILPQIAVAADGSDPATDKPSTAAYKLSAAADKSEASRKLSAATDKPSAAAYKLSAATDKPSTEASQKLSAAQVDPVWVSEEPRPVGGWSPLQIRQVTGDVVEMQEDPGRMTKKRHIINSDSRSDDPVFTRGASTVGYDSLKTDAQRDLYREMDAAAKNFMRSQEDAPRMRMATAEYAYVAGHLNYGQKGIDNADEAYQVFYAYDYDHPAYYWISNVLWINEVTQEMWLSTEREYRTAAARSEINDYIIDGVKELAALAENGTDTLDEIALVHDKIVSEIDYAYESGGKTPESDKWAHSVQGFFDPKYSTSVCEGYADTFALIMNYLDIPNYYVVGLAYGGGHAWNVVSCDGGATYMYMDLTWDDISGENYTYEYFGMPASEFEKDHKEFTPAGQGIYWLYDLPANINDSFEGSYYSKGGFYYDSSKAETITSSVGARVKAGRVGTCFTFACKKDEEKDQTEQVTPWEMANLQEIEGFSAYEKTIGGVDYYICFKAFGDDKIDISSAAVSDAEYYYEDGQIRPEPTVVHKGVPLIEGYDYQIRYSMPEESGENAQPDQVTATVTGTGNYKGQLQPVALTVQKKPHTHTWSYTAEGDTITASCENCTLGKGIHRGKATLTIRKPEHWIYADGLSPAATMDPDQLAFFNQATGRSIQKADISYYKAKLYTDEDVNRYIGEGEPLEGPPEDAGHYIAEINVSSVSGDSVTASVDYEIAKASSVIVTAPEASAITYGQTLEDSQLTGGLAKSGVAETAQPLDGTFVWKEPSMKPDATGEEGAEFDVLFAPENVDSVIPAETRVRIVVDKADPVVTAPAAKTLTFTGSAQELIAAGTIRGGAIRYQLAGEAEDSIDAEEWTETIPRGTDAGSYYVWYRVEGDSNYDSTAPACIKVTIAKMAAPDGKSLSEAQKPHGIEGLTDTGEAQDLVTEPAQMPAHYDKVWYSADDGKTWSESIPTGTTEGNYTIKVWYQGDANHEDFPGDEIQVSIEPKAASGTDDPSTPGSGDGTSPGTDDPSTPGSGDGTSPGTDDPSTPGSGDGTTPGTDDPSTPGSGDGTSPGTDDPSTPGSGDGTTPGTEDPSTPATPGRGDGRGSDGTAFGPGASLDTAEREITGRKSDADPAGSVFWKLQAASVKQTKTSISLKWKKVVGASRYIIYGNKCGKGNRQQRQLATAKNSCKLTKVKDNKMKAGKVKKGAYYKFTIIAVDKNNKVLSTSRILHVATKGGKVGNHKKITTKARKNKVSLKKGKTFKLKAKAVPRSKKLKVKKHRAIAYETTDGSIATVSKKGVIKAKAKGTCYVYAYAQNGVCTKIKVRVK